VIAFNVITADDAARRLAHMPGNPKWDTTDGMAAITEIIGGGLPLLVVDGAEELAVVVIDLDKYENGRELVVRVAHQLAKRGDLTETVLPEIVRRFGGGCNSVSMRTRRPGLVAKLQRAGFSQAAVIMRKEINVQE
jgi:hypothetical protein